MQIRIQKSLASASYFMVTWLELQALNQYRILLEENLQQLIDARGGLGWDPPRDDDPENVKAWFLQGPIDDMVVQSFRRSFVLCLWATFESCLVTVADELATRRVHSPSGLVGRKSFLKAAKKHFSRELGIELFPHGRRETRLHRLDRVRNALSHGYGSKGPVFPEKWKQLERDARGASGLDTSGNYIRIERAYLDEAFDDVFGILIPVIEQARSQIDQGSREGS